MRVLLEHDNGSTEELKADILPADAKVILMRTGILLMPAEMDRLSNILTEQIGVKVILLPAYVKEIRVIPEDNRQR